MSSQREYVPSRPRGTFAVLARNLRVWRRFFLSNAVGALAEPVLYLVALGYGLGGLIVEIDGMSYMRFIAPGLVMSAVMYSATFEGTYGTYTRMDPQHTFEGMLATPVGISEIMMGEILYAGCKAFLAGSMVLAVEAALGLIDSPLALLTPVLCLMCGVLFGGLAVLVSSLSPSYDFFNYYFTLAVAPMLLFGGIFFPLEQLPEWAQILTWANPLTHAVSATHHLFSGRLELDLIVNLVCLLLFAVLPLYPTSRLLRRRLIH